MSGGSFHPSIWGALLQPIAQEIARGETVEARQLDGEARLLSQPGRLAGVLHGFLDFPITLSRVQEPPLETREGRGGDLAPLSPATYSPTSRGPHRVSGHEGQDPARGPFGQSLHSARVSHAPGSRAAHQGHAHQ